MFRVKSTPGVVQICNIGLFQVAKFLNSLLFFDHAVSPTNRQARAKVLPCHNHGYHGHLLVPALGMTRLTLFLRLLQ